HIGLRAHGQTSIVPGKKYVAWHRLLMCLLLVLGGARAGKSDFAQRLALASGLRVTLIATAAALDSEMAERIERHRALRPPLWSTVEEQLDLSGAMGAAGDSSFLIVDCLTLWVSNL